jgi:hypothetical protein
LTVSNAANPRASKTSGTSATTASQQASMTHRVTQNTRLSVAFRPDFSMAGVELSWVVGTSQPCERNGGVSSDSTRQRSGSPLTRVRRRRIFTFSGWHSPIHRLFQHLANPLPTIFP